MVAIVTFVGEDPAVDQSRWGILETCIWDQRILTMIGWWLPTVVVVPKNLSRVSSPDVCKNPSRVAKKEVLKDVVLEYFSHHLIKND